MAGAMPVSPTAVEYFPDTPASEVDNALGSDFEWTDPKGKLTGKPYKKVYLEVKSCVQSEPQPFRMSTNEWSLAERCHATRKFGKNAELYVIAVVTGVTSRTDVRLAKLLPDPLQQVKDGNATAVASELVIYPQY